MIPWETLQNFTITMGLCLARITAAGSVAPFLSSSLVPGLARNSILFALALVLFPLVSPTLPPGVSWSLTTVAIIIKEVLIGILVGFLAGLPFWLAMSVGFFIDNQRGAAMASLFDPMAGEQTSPIGQFLIQSLTVLFFATGGFLFFVNSLFESYVAWPVVSFFPHFQDAFPEFILGQADRMMRLVVILAAPVIVGSLIAEFGLGLMNRFAPQLNVFSVSMAVKSVSSMIVLLVYLPFLMYLFRDELVKGPGLLNLLGAMLGG